jgi:hypothetical protein
MRRYTLSKWIHCEKWKDGLGLELEDDNAYDDPGNAKEVAEKANPIDTTSMYTKRKRGSLLCTRWNYRNLIG